MRFTGSLWTTTFQGTSRDSSVLLSCSTSVPGMSGKTRLLSGRGSAGKRGRFRGRGRGRRREQRLELIDPARSIRMRGEGLDQGEHFRGGAIFVADGGEVLAAAPEELRPAHGVELIHFEGELRAGGPLRFVAQLRVPIIDHVRVFQIAQLGLNDEGENAIDISRD